MVQFFKPGKSGSNAQPSRPVVLPLTVDGLDDQGRGVARSDAARGTPVPGVVFVPGALPGEKVTARVSTEGKIRIGQLVSVDAAASGRTTPPCPVYAECGGCRLQHASALLQRDSKQALLLHQLRQLGQVVPETVDAPVCGEPWAYRRRARLALRVDRDGLRLGFRTESSQSICDVDACAVLRPELSATIPAVRAVLSAHALPRDFGHVELISTDDGVVWLLRRLRALPEDRLAALVASVPPGVHLRFEDDDGVVRDPSGSVAEALHYCIDMGASSLSVAFQAHHFIQVNGEINQLLIQRTLAYLDLKPGEKVADLFCGGGNFSLALAHAGASVTGIEGVAAMVRQANANAVAAGLSAQFLLGDLANGVPKSLMDAGPFDAVLLDPSREGAKGVVAELAKLGARRVVYVSCNPATLARDAGMMVRSGWQLRKVALVDMFPQTHHLEAVALFESV